MTRLRVLIVLLLLAAPCGALASESPLATRAVAIATGDGAGQASVAVYPREGFVVTWQEQDRSGHSLRFAVLDRDGRERRRGLVARGENWFVNWADFPSLVVLDNGDWVTHWLVRNGEDPHGYDIRLVRSRDAGRTWETPVSPHDDGTPTQHGFVSLVPAGNDRVLVIWLDGRRGAAAGGRMQQSGDDRVPHHGRPRPELPAARLPSQGHRKRPPADREDPPKHSAARLRCRLPIRSTQCAGGSAVRSGGVDQRL